MLANASICSRIIKHLKICLIIFGRSKPSAKLRLGISIKSDNTVLLHSITVSVNFTHLVTKGWNKTEQEGPEDVTNKRKSNIGHETDVIL